MSAPTTIQTLYVARIMAREKRIVAMSLVLALAEVAWDLEVDQRDAPKRSAPAQSHGPRRRPGRGRGAHASQEPPTCLEPHTCTARTPAARGHWPPCLRRGARTAPAHTVVPTPNPWHLRSRDVPPCKPPLLPPVAARNAPRATAGQVGEAPPCAVLPRAVPRTGPHCTRTAAAATPRDAVAHSRATL